MDPALLFYAYACVVCMTMQVAATTAKYVGRDLADLLKELLRIELLFRRWMDKRRKSRRQVCRPAR